MSVNGSWMGKQFDDRSQCSIPPRLTQPVGTVGSSGSIPWPWSRWSNSFPDMQFVWGFGA